MHESGILVKLDNDVIGRVKLIGEQFQEEKPFDIIISLEKTFRKLIIDVLSKDDPNWWENRINPTVRERAQEKHQKNKQYKSMLQIPNYELIDETDFSDIPLIVLGDKNWKKYFEHIFKDKNALQVKLSELLQYRNLLAHSKDIDKYIEQKIHLYYRDLVYLINSYYGTNR